RVHLEAAVAETLLKGYLVGSGSSNQPTGLTSLSGTSSVTASTTDSTVVMQSLLRAMQKVEENQGDLGQCVFVMHPKAWYYLMSVLNSGTGTVGAATATTTQQLPLGMASAFAGINTVGQKTILGIPVYLTTAVTVTDNATTTPDTTTILLYQPSNTIFADFGPMELLVTNAGSTLGLADQTLVRVVQEVDFNARLAAQVVKITGVYAGIEN
ncbi:MAG: phage major capsid protein, partial [Actinobacteria bacterium]|nr:phage major capsid protein [Actinomycetota bacterium]